MFSLMSCASVRLLMWKILVGIEKHEIDSHAVVWNATDILSLMRAL